MRWLDRLERRFGDWSIPEFPLFIVAANGTIYLMSMFRPEVVYRLTLDPAAIYHGEVWRLLTFLFIPPPMGPISMIFTLFFLYFCAKMLEQEWGEFRFAFFYFIGGAATAAAALLIAKEPLGNIPLNLMVFLAFATLDPEHEIYIYFIRVRVKYLAYFFWLLLAWWFVTGSFATRVAVGASLVNYLLFFGADLWQAVRLKWDVYQNRKKFRDS